MEVVEKAWNSGTFFSNSSKDLVARFKVARKELKFWRKNLSNLDKLIDKCCYIIAMIYGLEEQILLSLQEHNFRKIVKAHTTKLLEAK